MFLGEHKHALDKPCPSRFGGHQRGALRDRQHEDEVEEELERRDALALAEGCGQSGCAGRRSGAHRSMVTAGGLGAAVFVDRALVAVQTGEQLGELRQLLLVETLLEH